MKLDSVRLLQIVLIMCGATCMLAFVAMFMPEHCMASSHKMLGMGEFPDQPVAEQLARMTSGMYGTYGLLVVLMAFDVRRYSMLVTAQAFCILAVAVATAALGWNQGGLPQWWLGGDVGSTTAYCAAVLVLQRLVVAKDKNEQKS